MLLALLLAASPAAPLNTEGYRLYRAGQYEAALEQFRAAVKADERHALSHYNLAATLALLRGQGKVCEVEAYQGRILSALERAVQLDRRRLARAKVDPDFTSIHDTLGYQRLLGRSPRSLRDVRPLLVAVTWLGPAPGAFGNLYTLDLTDDGGFAWSQKVLDPDFHVEVTKGRWTVSGRQVTLRFEKPVDGRSEVVGELKAGGQLTFPAAGWELTDQPSECDA